MDVAFTFACPARSYVINYNLGQDMVGRFVDKFAAHAAAADAASVERRWRLFQWLLSTPQVPANLLV